MKFDFNATIRHRWLCMITTAWFAPLIYLTLTAVAVFFIDLFTSERESVIEYIMYQLPAIIWGVIIFGGIYSIVLSVIYLPISILTILMLTLSYKITKNKYLQLGVILTVPFLISFLSLQFNLFGVGGNSDTPWSNFFVGLLATAPMFISFYVSKRKVEEVKIVDNWE